ncbi:hypothetical protein D3C77_304500 [compost metagenome]
MGLVYNHGIFPRGQMALVTLATLLAQLSQLSGDKRKLLQRSNDDRDTSFECLGELA